MSETNVKFGGGEVAETPETPGSAVVGALSVNDVQVGIDSLVQIGNIVASMSRNATIAKVVSVFSGLANQPWFVNLIVAASGLLDKGKSGAASELIAGGAPPDVVGGIDGVVVAGGLSPADVKAGIDSLLQVGTVIGAVTRNASIIKTVSVIGEIARQEWFVSVIVSLSGFVVK